MKNPILVGQKPEISFTPQIREIPRHNIPLARMGGGNLCSAPHTFQGLRRHDHHHVFAVPGTHFLIEITTVGGLNHHNTSGYDTNNNSGYMMVI